MKRERKNRINDKGFTLVELLITIAIIAVIISPILGGIVTSMKINKKSDALQKETAMANTVMEGMENMSLEDIAVKLSDNNSDVSDMFPVGVCDASSRVGEIETSAKCITEITATPTPTPKTTATPVPTLPAGVTATATPIPVTPAPNYIYDFTKNSTGKYVFGLKDMKYDGEVYDVRVTLDASNALHQSFNDALYVDIAGFDKNQDGIFAQDDASDKEICGGLAVEAAAMGNQITANDIDARASRTITVKIYTSKEIDINGKEHTYTKADVRYEKEVPQSYVGTGVSNIGFRENKEFYTNKEDESKALRNLYIMFEPNYNAKGGSITEKIVIENEENIPVNVFLIKQNNDTDNLIAAEQNYTIEVESIFNTADGSNPTTIRTNLGYNLASLLNNKIEKANHCRLIMKNNFDKSETTYSGDGFLNAVETITSGNNKYVRVFDKKVEVFSKGSCKQIGGTGEYYFDGTPLTTIDSVVQGTP